MTCKVDEVHRKELLRFLLVKTAGVRLGIKPGELLRVQHCYKKVNSDGLHFCLYRKDVLNTLQLDYVVLNVDDKSSLILFYHQDEMTKTLAMEENLNILTSQGYQTGNVKRYLEQLQDRFKVEKIPHEVGVFIGYPAKDVTGFIDKSTPVHRGSWTIFGDKELSLAKMHLYGCAESVAKSFLDISEDVQTFFQHISSYRGNLTTVP